MSPVGPVPGRVVRVQLPTSSGTGYLVGPDLVLTAAHVVRAQAGDVPATVAVGVPDRQPVDGMVVWLRQDERADAALIRVGSAGFPWSLVTRFGRFVTAAPDQAVEAIGFPRQQKFALLRDQEQLSGVVSPETGAVSGHYELTSTTPLPARPSDDPRSPWRGMSGAAVFSAGLLVGVVRSDRRPAAGTRLIVTSMAELLADNAFLDVVRDAAPRPICEPVELAGFLESPYANRNVRSVAALLRSDAETVRFHGREGELARLESWCVGPEPLSVMIVSGQGGEGKTRLARRLTALRRASGWTTGVLRSSTTGAEESYVPVRRTKEPVLIVIDYAEDHHRQVRALLWQARAAHGPVRILLLVRDRAALADALDDLDAELRDLVADAPELALTPLASTEDVWDESFRTAVDDLAAGLRAVPDHQNHDWPNVAARVVTPSTRTHKRSPSALGVQMTALTALLQEAMPIAAEPGEPVERTLLRHEEAYWSRAARRAGLTGVDRATRRSAVAALSLVHVPDEDQTVGLLGALGIADTAVRRDAARWLHELYPDEDAYLGGVAPDRLAEFLLVEACAADHDLLTRIVTGARNIAHPGDVAALETAFGAGHATDHASMDVLREAVRAARSQKGLGNQVRPLLEQIERTASHPVVTDRVLNWAFTNVSTLPGAGRRQEIERGADGSSVIKSELDPASAALQIAAYRRGLDSWVKDSPRDQGFAHLMHATTLAQLGRVEDALEVSAMAVACFRVVGDPGELAFQLDYQAKLLVRLGRDAEAVDVLVEAVDLRRSAPPDYAFLSAVDMLVTALRRLGQTARALPYARWDVESRRPASGMPTKDKATEYVRALARYADLLATERMSTESLDCVRRAEEFIAGLPTAVDGWSGERAVLAETKASALADLGDQPGSVAAWLESAEHWHRVDGPLGDIDPVQHEVASRNNAAVGHARLDDHATALAVIQDAVELALSERGESLRRDEPALYEQVHLTYISYLVKAGQPEIAVREAERLWQRPVASTQPLPPAFAILMTDAGESLHESGRLGEATSASRISVAVFGSAALPANDLGLAFQEARALTVHTANLVRTCAVAEAMKISAQAVATWRRVCAREPRLSVNLVYAMVNRAAALKLADRYGDAGATYAAARLLLDGVAGQDQQMRAGLFAGEAACAFAEERHEDAVAARRQELAIRIKSWQENRSGTAELADAYADLAISQERLDRLSQAFVAADRALGFYRHVYGRDPGRRWQRVARVLVAAGHIRIRIGKPVSAVRFFAEAIALALRAGDRDFAASCQEGISLAAAADPVGVAVEFRRLLG